MNATITNFEIWRATRREIVKSFVEAMRDVEAAERMANGPLFAFDDPASALERRRMSERTSRAWEARS